MRVRTLRKHINAYPPVPVKNLRREYEVSERDGRNLIASGLVEEVVPPGAPDEGEGEGG